MRLINIFLLLLAPYLASAQKQTREITFPNTTDFLTLKCDFHIHTVFSDGSVWPNIRVEEAVRDGLDAISLTEHLEYQPHAADMPHQDRNRSYEIAREQAKAFDLLIIHGAEITRNLPPGHANAIFIKDANKLNIKDSIAAYREVKNQGGFVFWNHPNWIAQKEDGVAELTDLHRMLIDEGLLHGIEVVNDLTYSDEALDIALNHNLTVIGTSDIHGLVDWQYDIANGGHRPMLLVLAKEKSETSIKEAMFAGRTIAWFKNLLVGKAEHVVPLIEASIKLGKATYQGPSSVAQVTLVNSSDATYLLRNRSDFNFHDEGDVVTLPAQGQLRILVKTKQQQESFDLKFEVLNAMVGGSQHPEVLFEVIVDL